MPSRPTRLPIRRSPPGPARKFSILRAELTGGPFPGVARFRMRRPSEFTVVIGIALIVSTAGYLAETAVQYCAAQQGVTLGQAWVRSIKARRDTRVEDCARNVLRAPWTIMRQF